MEFVCLKPMFATLHLAFFLLTLCARTVLSLQIQGILSHAPTIGYHEASCSIAVLELETYAPELLVIVFQSCQNRT